MPSIISLINRIQQDHPKLAFEVSDRFSWNPEDFTITYTTHYLPHKLLHEVAHSILNHTEYDRDIELLDMERVAWEKAAQLGELYNIQVSIQAIEDALDTYRDWMHSRSICPVCSSTGIQNSTATYRCVSCYNLWRVNEARTCELRRYKIKKTSL